MLTLGIRQRPGTQADPLGSGCRGGPVLGAPDGAVGRADGLRNSERRLHPSGEAHENTVEGRSEKAYPGNDHYGNEPQ